MFQMGIEYWWFIGANQYQLLLKLESSYIEWKPLLKGNQFIGETPFSLYYNFFGAFLQTQTRECCLEII